MPNKTLHRSGTLPDVRFHESLDVDPARPTEKLAPDSDVSRILVVDDDSGILALVSRMAASLGHLTTTAGDAVDALYFLDKTHFDVVITDYDMPLMDGLHLAHQIKKKYFGTMVIIMTGHCEDLIAKKPDGSDVVHGLLLKPFNLETLKEKIDRCRLCRTGGKKYG